MWGEGGREEESGVGGGKEGERHFSVDGTIAGRLLVCFVPVSAFQPGKSTRRDTRIGSTPATPPYPLGGRGGGGGKREREKKGGKMTGQSVGGPMTKLVCCSGQCSFLD